MLSLLKKIWHDPVWSKVLATTLIAVSAWLISNWWSTVLAYVVGVSKFLSDKSALSNWQIGILVCLSSLFVLGLLFLLWEASQNKHELDWKKYRQDVFFGLRWRWKYSYGNNYPVDLCTFCLKCDYQIEPTDRGGYTGMTTQFWCENDSCDQGPIEIKGSRYDLEKKVIKSLQLKIRNGSWLSSTR